MSRRSRIKLNHGAGTPLPAEENVKLVGQAKPRIAIAMATHDQNPSRFTIDLANLVGFTSSQLPEGWDFGCVMETGTYVHSGRQSLLESMIEQGITHVLWLDTDMRFPRNALARLLKHRLPLVGINYSQRVDPPQFVAFKTVSYDDPNGVSERLVTGPDSTGLEQVEAIGFGMVLMRLADIIPVLPDLDKTPWFFFEWLKGRRQVGEDVWFCRLMNQAGIKIMVDHDLSKECAHTGYYDYTCDLAWRVLQEDKEEAAA